MLITTVTSTPVLVEGHGNNVALDEPGGFAELRGPVDRSRS